jgi:hypothetical protein
VTVGSAVAGAAVDAWGAETAFAVPAMSAALAGVLALVGGRLLRGPDAVPVDLPQGGTDRVADRKAG